MASHIVTPELVDRVAYDSQDTTEISKEMSSAFEQSKSHDHILMGLAMMLQEGKDEEITISPEQLCTAVRFGMVLGFEVAMSLADPAIAN